MTDKELVLKTFKESIEAKERFATDENSKLVCQAAQWIVESFKSGGKLLIVGNGGSASDAQHLAAEFVNRFEIERPPLPALALTTDSSILTSIGNDYDFDLVFSKQVKALARSGDLLLAISTSGNSANIIKAVEAAKEAGIKTISLTGKDGGELATIADLAINVNEESTGRTQEVHITVCHIICALVDGMLFERTGKGQG